mmetsp:Transcript_2540/g.2937  ORF Transcript_2540/g.2937 Transcript_2540/m.2937 type:complete len:225 (+) Transcript_2540:97-771(+)
MDYDAIQKMMRPPTPEGEESYPYCIDSMSDDHHFGMEAECSGTSEPYTNHGRTELLWKTLIAYGFERVTDSKGKHSFKDKIPHPCFEFSIRSQFKNNGKVYKYPHAVDQETGIIMGWEIDTLSNAIRSGDAHVDCSQMKNNAELVRNACSTDGVSSTSGWNCFYSFCRDGSLESTDNTWHCKSCKQCQDWREWHCKGCNECQYGMSIPCQNCTPDMHRSRIACG